MSINITNITNVQSLEGMFELANASTNGILFGFILIIIFGIIVIRTKDRGVDRAVAGGSFICLFLSLFMIRLGWIMIIYPIAFSIILAGTLFYIRFSNN